MDLQRQEFTTSIAGKQVKLEVSRIAEQATSAVLGTFGDTSVLVTATMGKEDRNIDYFPLVIDYEEKFYAAGKIIGSRFIRREGRPSEEAVLSGRLIDRTLRPLFDHSLRKDVQIIITVLAYDEESEPDFIALLAASTALAISPIPWGGPVAGIKLVRLKDGTVVINPGSSGLKGNSDISFEAFVSGTAERINMIELAGNEADESAVIESFETTQKEIKSLIEFQNGVVKYIGKPKIEIAKTDSLADLKLKVKEFLNGKLEQAIYVEEKSEMKINLGDLKKNLKEYLAAEGASPSDLPKTDRLVDEEIDELVHKNILESDKRPDGRGLDQVRDLYAEISLFRRLHGSALFMRGNTQALAVVTLAPPGAEQMVETMEVSAKRRFMLHYNFPPYSVGEISRLGSPGRREIGHGALAEKAVRSLIPLQADFPYTIRIVSEILSSNGSSSMATVCASSLALMDAGVPIKKHVAGIAMGLMTGKGGEYKVLTDIQGPEDHYGDMDCKVAGTKDGVTAIQMDVKIDGVTTAILKEIFEQAKKARLSILEVLDKTIDKPRDHVSEYAPVIMTTEIRPDQIGEIIGPAGKIINGIIRSTGVLSIDVEQTGLVYVAASDYAKAEAAIQSINAITKEFKVGEIVEGPVIKIMDFGAIVDLGGGRDGMIHVSELKNGFVQRVEDVVRIGDKVKVKVVRAEEGRIGLSLKAMGNDESKKEVRGDDLDEVLKELNG